MTTVQRVHLDESHINNNLPSKEGRSVVNVIVRSNMEKSVSSDIKTLRSGLRCSQVFLTDFEEF